MTENKELYFKFLREYLKLEDRGIVKAMGNCVKYWLDYYDKTILSLGYDDRSLEEIKTSKMIQGQFRIFFDKFLDSERIDRELKDIASQRNEETDDVKVAREIIFNGR